MFWMAWPDAPFTKLSIAENIITLSFTLVSHMDISQKLVLRTLPEPIFEFNFKIFINLDLL